MPKAKLGVIQYMEAIVEMQKRNTPKDRNWPYVCMEDFVLKEGKAFSARGCKVERGKMKECFANAWRLAHEANLIYVEGYAASIIPVHHAWCVDNRGKVYEPTWEKFGSEYFGVEFDLGYVTETVMKKKTFGVIDDWVNGYPLLTGAAVNFKFK